MTNVLFTSAGRRVELLERFRKAYEELHLEGKIVAADADPLAPALHRADSSYIVPPLEAVDYVPRLAELCRRERIDLVFPLIDPDIPILSMNRDLLEACGTTAVVVPAAAVEVSCDKWRTMMFFRKLGLSVPLSWLPGDPDIAAAGYPLFIRPRRGSAGIGAYAVHDAEELAFLVKRVHDPIIQEYLPGPEITTDVVCGLDGELLGIVSRQRLAVRAGEVLKGVTIYDRRIIDACSLIARQLPAIGPVTVQCMMKDGVPHFTEINARFGGGVPLGIAAGVDSPRWLLARSAGLPVQIPPPGTYKTGLYFTRCDQSFFIGSAELADLARHTV